MIGPPMPKEVARATGGRPWKGWPRLDAEGTAAAAGRLHLRIIEFETGAFQCLDVIDLGAIKIKQAGLIDEHLQASETIRLVEHVGLVLEGHGIAKARASPTDNGNAQTGRLGLLSIQNLPHLADCFLR